MNRRLFLLTGAGAMIQPGAAYAPMGPPSVPYTRSGDPAFDAWAQAFGARAVAAGVPEAVVRQEMASLTPDPRVVGSDRGQPELSRSVGDYLKSAVSDAKVQRGRALMAEDRPYLNKFEERYGVPALILIGVWGMESAYGAIQGDKDVIRSLATLAYEGRRRDWAEIQLIAALRILSQERIPRSRLQGSWAGAMGQTQFIPQTYLDTAVDGDGDGKRDIWGSAPDALGSAANLLAKAGWRRGEGWAREVILPRDFDHSLAEGPRYPISQWLGMGVRAADGRTWSAADKAASAGLILPAGARGPAFLVLPNHFVIRAYNNSISYALAVGLLGEAAAGRPGLVTPWPVEEPMTLADRKGAQAALNRLGYDVGEPDGVVGTKTRAAVRAWQKANGLVADGHLNVDLARRLQQAPAGTTPPPVS
jgi:peptidoglycan lytic transglycosylase B